MDENTKTLTEAQEALSRFCKGKQVMKSPAGPDSDDIKIQKALLLLQEFIENKVTTTLTTPVKYEFSSSQS